MMTFDAMPHCCRLAGYPYDIVGLETNLENWIVIEIEKREEDVYG